MKHRLVSLSAALIGLTACSSSSTSESATEVSSGTESATTQTPSDDPDLFVSTGVGFALRKPSGWHFQPTAWRDANMENLDFKDDDFGEAVKKHATKPLVIVSKYESTGDTLNPALQTVFRPLGSLADMTPEEVAKMSMRTMPRMFSDFEVVEDVVTTEVGGHPAARYKAAFTVTNQEGATFRTLADTWVVKRGPYIFIIGSSGPRNGEDASGPEFEAMVKSIVIEPLP